MKEYVDRINGGGRLAMDNDSERKFHSLTSALDYILKESRDSVNVRALNDAAGDFDIDKARARAFIHLYLQVAQGITDPAEREKFITEGPGDGGLDAFHIDHDKKIVHLIQSKFRTNPKGFEEKALDPKELNKLQIDRILSGEAETDQGERFNGRINGFQRIFSEISALANYEICIVMLANVSSDTKSLMDKIFRNYDIEIYDYERTYSDLLFPLISSDSYYSSNLKVHIDTSEKVSAPRLSTQVDTRFGPCQLSVFLVPTFEIAKILRSYKNAILRYNPRSYLEFEQQSTNEKIKDSIEGETKGEFALLNNGITIICDKCIFTDKTGVKGRAGAFIYNPQIINGGQTAFTLATILDAQADPEHEGVFEGKEVLLRVISLEGVPEHERPELISDISIATNTQTSVTHADRRANNELHRDIAARLFRLTGYLYEYKTGGFALASRAGMASPNVVIDRNKFHRLIYLASGSYSKAIRSDLMRKGRSLLVDAPKNEDLLKIPEMLDLFNEISAAQRSRHRQQADIFRDCVIAEAIRQVAKEADVLVSLRDVARLSAGKWEPFLSFSGKLVEIEIVTANKSGQRIVRKGVKKSVEKSKWVESGVFFEDLKRFARTILEESLTLLPQSPASSPSPATARDTAP